MSLDKTITILNKRASFEYTFLEKYVAGMVLSGTEIKSIRLGKANITDGFCVIENGEMIARNIQINEYDKGTYNNHEPKQDRKLLLKKSEIRKLQNKLKDQGLTIIPIKLFISDKGWAKLEIALAKGKKLFDKRDDIKKRDTERELQRKLK
ncbi:MAG: SsrA-binding protein SmpB [Bacteroidetes bacterium]|jgi:SsrA-binding protein|nr:SsrA-binding protein SmpB [Bacteroidota bacterium]